MESNRVLILTLESVDIKPAVWLFTWNLFASTFTRKFFFSAFYKKGIRILSLGLSLFWGETVNQSTSTWVNKNAE